MGEGVWAESDGGISLYLTSFQTVVDSAVSLIVAFSPPENRNDFYFLTGYPASLTSNLREKASAESNVCFFESR